MSAASARFAAACVAPSAAVASLRAGRAGARWAGRALRPLVGLAVWGAMLAIVWVALLGAGAVRAQDLQPVPALTARVTDTSGTLTPAQRQALEAQLATFEREAGTQIVVLVVPTTQPEDIAAYAFRVADTWKIGRRGVGDGLLILVAMQDKRFRIEVARDLEGAVPDLAASRVIDQALRPAFRRGDYAGGLSAAIDQLAALVRGEALPAPEPQRGKRQGGGIGWEELAMFFFVGVPVVGAVFTGVLGRKLGSLATGGAAGAIAWFVSTSLLLAGLAGLVALVLVGVMGVGAAGRRGGGVPIIWGGGGWGGGGGFGGGGGGGGFSSGGGGSFGGGGASGGW